MGRTATAFLALVAVGGCVADDQGPAAAVLAAQHGQATVATNPTYATWNRTDQFATQHESTPTDPPPSALTPPPPLRITNSTALKPGGVHKPVIVPAPMEKAALAAGPNGLPAEPTVDPDLAAATLVQTGGTEPAAKDAPPAKETSTVKEVPAIKDIPAVKETPAAKDAPEPATTTALTASPTGAPSATRMVNSKRITLNYELKDVGASGVGGVEMWCTQDTRTWKKGEVVAQTNHSFTVEVKDEGLYGFTLLARNGSGAGKDVPQPGDQPQVWVSVDVTKPVVQITSLELTHGGKAPTIMIRWSAKDKNIGPRPINLSFSEEADGPWSPIATGLENSGQYEWQPSGAVPHHLYVRVEATDLHGNVGTAQTSNPMRVEASGATAAATPTTEPPAAAPVGAARKPLPAPPALDASRPSTAILAVEPNSN